MLEKPDLSDEDLIACVQVEYGLSVIQVAFLPLGADLNTAVYRVVTDGGASYFLKSRQGAFDEISVTLPKFLGDQGIPHIIAPLATQTGRLWANLNAFKLILYPFVEGRNGYETELSDRHWMELGAALKRIHTVVVPPILISNIPPETYSPHWREVVKTFLARIEVDTFADPVAVDMAAFLRAKRAEVVDLVGRAERLAQLLQTQTPEFTVCHSDIHAGNVLIAAHDAFYIVDWDNPILAPKERDLMFVGGGQGFIGHTTQEEEILFYQGYGQTAIDPAALAYYRYERIIQDIAIYCEQIFLTEEGSEDREQSFHYLMSNFQPNGTIEIAYQSDKTSCLGATWAMV